MTYPGDGDYIFPEGLTLLSATGKAGVSWEPNIWMQHDLQDRARSSANPGDAARRAT